MKLIVGLCNPGVQYEKTRHNLGAQVIEHVLKDMESVEKTTWENSLKLKSDIAQTYWQPRNGPRVKVLLAKPKTYMNNSGMAVQLLVSFYKISPDDVWIIHDDLDLPLGTLRIRCGGASGGHKGVNSIIDALHTDLFWRFRLGIGRPDGDVIRKDVDDYVLGTFTPQDHAKIKDVIKRSTQAIFSGLEFDLHTAMNKYNTK